MLQRIDNNQPFTLPPGYAFLPYIGVVLNHCVNVLQDSGEETYLLFLGFSYASVNLFSRKVSFFKGFGANRNA